MNMLIAVLRELIGLFVDDGSLALMILAVVTLAGIVFIIAVIFWSGFILGAGEGDEGGHHDGHGEGGSGQESGGSERHNGMTPYGVVIEQNVPSAGFAG